MEGAFEQLTDREILAIIGDGLDALFDDRLRLSSDAEQLVVLQEAVRLGGRLQVWQERLAARIEKSEAAWNERKTSTATWLAESMNLTARDAKRLVKAGQGMERFPIVGSAAAAGHVLPGQAGAITAVLGDLPREFDHTVITKGQEMMVEFAQTHNSAELRRLTSYLVEVLSPETADQIEARRLERQERRAQAHRFLEFKNDGDGSVLIRGSLPVAAAEPFIRIVDAYTAADKRALEALDPNTDYVTPAMRRADGLLAMVNAHSQQALAPSNGGDRPRIVVTLSYESLIKQCADVGLGAQLTRIGEHIPASVARQLLCDADILPAVLDGRSEILDVGRAQRLVTPPIRAALELRDGGCIFPGCDKPPDACHAHHVVPWWNGGATSLSNLVLACPHHHGIIEPGHDPTTDRWQARIRNGRAEVIPPKRVDPQQRPRIHARFRARRRASP